MLTIESGINALHDRLDFRWATLLRRDGGLRAPTRRTPETLHLAPTAFRRRKIPALAQQGRLFSSTRRAWRSGGTGGSGEPPAQKHGAVCADRLPKKWTARASGIFTGALTTVPINREWPLCQSADWKSTAVDLSRPQILELRGWGATLLSSRVE